jgi:hypothetical protein
MEMDWYMFTPAEHEYFRFLETGVVPARFAELVKSPTRKRAPRVKSPANWRVFGEKVNKNKNTRRRYYKCTIIHGCPARRLEIFDATTGKLRKNIEYETHCSNCSRLQRKIRG